MNLMKIRCSLLGIVFGLVSLAARAATGDNASFVSMSVPQSMAVGGTYQVSVTFKNTGTTTWTAANNYRLGAQDPQDNTTWGTGRAYLSSTDSIAPGQQKTFTFTVTAPATPSYTATNYFNFLDRKSVV